MLQKGVSLIILLIIALSSSTVFGQCDMIDSLFLSVRSNDEAKVRALLNDSNLNRIDQRRCTPLIYAVKNRNLQLAAYMISKGAKVNFPPNGYSPVMAAAENKDLKMLEILHRNGADFSAVDSTEMVWGGATTVLDYSISDGCYCEDVFNFLLENGAIVKGSNILPYAIYIRNMEHTKKLELIQGLIDSGADLNVTGDSGFPILDMAKMLWDNELCDMLEEAGATDTYMDDDPEEQEILTAEGCDCPTS